MRSAAPEHVKQRFHSTRMIDSLGSVREAVTVGTENLHGHDAGNGGYSQGDTILINQYPECCVSARFIGSRESTANGAFDLGPF